MDDTGQVFDLPFLTSNLGFHTEIAKAGELVGQELWTTGWTLLFSSPKKNLGDDASRDVKIGPVTKLVVESVDWANGPGASAMAGRFRFVLGLRGQDNRVSFFPVEGFFDVRFRQIGSDELGVWKAQDDDFLKEDPQKKYSKWNAEIWRLIKAGRVAIGMELE